MLEFGSDFHYINNTSSSSNLLDKNSFILLANGRQAIEFLIKENQWRRIWMPEYFCYEIVDYIRRTGIEIKFYEDFPENDDEKVLSSLNFRDGDVLLRMNYFGLRSWRDSSKFGVPIIEDHSHCPSGQWAKNSTAEWCVASLRKTLPIAEGGILWSPIKQTLPGLPELTKENITLAKTRWEAMREKASYLKGEQVNRNLFRQKFIITEGNFDNLGISLIDKESQKFLDNFDYMNWFRRKQENWQILSSIKSKKIRILKSESNEIFSFTILCDTNETRNRLRMLLIENRIFPAILWKLPNSISITTLDFSERMLSIHCDARYSLNDIKRLKTIILKTINNV